MRRSARREAGVATLEYAAALAVAASLLISVAVTQATDGLDVLARNAICAVKSALGAAACATDPGDPGDPAFDPKPKRCTVRKRTEKVNSEIKIAFIKIGENAGFIETHYSDGTVSYTATDGAGIGVTGGLGADLEWGKLEAGAKVDFGFGVEATYGSTWIFKDKAEAERLSSQLQDYLTEQQILRHDPNYAIWLAIHGATEPPRPPDQQVNTIKVEGTAEGDLGVKLPWEQDRGPGTQKSEVPGLRLASVGIEFGTSGTWTEVHDQRNGNTIWTTEGEVTGAGELTGGPFGDKLSGLLGSSLAVTRNKDGMITKVAITTTRRGDLATSTRGGQGNLGGEGKDTNSEGKATVTTATLDVGTPEQRAIVEAWLSEGGVISPETAFPETLVPNDTLQNLMYTNATVSNVQYENVIDKTGFAAEVKVGVAFGVDFSLETEESRATRASYLGTSGPDGIRYPVDFPECVAR